MTTIAKRYHDISCGHRVHGHEGKCQHLHGHNYRIHFAVEAAELDEVGRVIDFSVIKSELCMWLEDNWDHKFLIWENDPISSYLIDIDSTVVLVPFNPTAENMAKYLVEVIGPSKLPKDVVLSVVEVEETSKCSAIYTL